MNKNLQVVFTLFVFGLTYLPAMSQHIVVKSKIIDAEEGKALPFANIMLLNHSIGTTSDIGGSFMLSIPQKNQRDTLVISYMGYQSERICIVDICPEGIELTPLAFELEVFHFVPGKVKRRTLNAFKKAECFVPYSNSITSNDDYWFPYRAEEPGIQAIFFPASHNPNTLIREVRILTESWTTPAYFRLRLLRADKSLRPTDDLLPDNLVIKVNQRNEWVKINLTDYQLFFPENGVFVGVELLLIPDNKREVMLPDSSSSVTLYSPFLKFSPARNPENTFWIYTAGKWKESQLTFNYHQKEISLTPAISLIIAN